MSLGKHIAKRYPRKLGSPELTSTNYSLKAANKLLVKHVGWLENVQVNVARILVPMDFTIVDTVKNIVSYLALLGRPWLYQTKCLQSWRDVTFTLTDGGNEVVLPMLTKGKYIVEVVSDDASNTTIVSVETSSTFNEANLLSHNRRKCKHK